MKQIICYCALLLAFIMSAGAGEAYAQKSSAKADKKIQKQQQDSLLRAQAVQSLGSKDFILGANRASVETIMPSIAPEHNYIYVDNYECVIFSEPGVANLDIYGEVKDYKISTDKRGATKVNIVVLASNNTYNVEILLDKSGNGATAKVSRQVGFVFLTYFGTITPYTTSHLNRGR